jgi:hypothetical protein
MATAQGFHKAHCTVCNRKTWHYAEAGSSGKAKCTDHSDYVVGRKHAIVGNMMLADFSKPVHQPTERELKLANKLDMSMWRSAEDRKSHVYVDADWATFPNSPEKDPNKLYCSFCGSEVDQVNQLTERKPVIRKVQDTYRNDSGEIIIQEKVVSRMETVHACPNCVLQIRKPITVRTV